jgi:hypothetical protein
MNLRNPFVRVIGSLMLSICRILGFAIAWCIKACGLLLARIGDEILKHTEK